MSKYLMKSAAAIVLGLAATACSHDIDYVVQEEQQSLDNAQATLGFYIPENQDWVMTTKVFANLPISGEAGQTYTVRVFSNEPLADGIGYVLTDEEVESGQNFVSTFRMPSYKTNLVIGITDSEGQTTYKRGDVVNGQIFSLTDINEARTRALGDYDQYKGTMKPVEWYQENGVWKTRAYTFPSDCAASNFLAETDMPNIDSYIALCTARNTGTSYDKGVSYLDPSYTGNVNISGKYENNMTSGGTLYIKGNNNFSNRQFTVCENTDVYLVGGATLTLNDNAASTIKFNLYIAPGAKLIANGSTGRVKLDNGAKLYNHGEIECKSFEVNNTSLFYNGSVGKLTTTGEVYVANLFSVIVNDGTIISGTSANKTGRLVTAGSGRVQNNAEWTVWGETIINSNANIWVNNGHFTTENYTYTATSSSVINNCFLTVHHNFCINIADGNGDFKIDSGGGVETEYFYGGGTFTAKDNNDADVTYNGGPFKVTMGSRSVFKVAKTAYMNALGSAIATEHYGFNGIGSDYAVLQAKNIVRQSLGEGNVAYSGNLYVSAEEHFEQGYSGQYPFIHYYDGCSANNIYAPGFASGKPVITIDPTPCNPGFNGETPDTQNIDILTPTDGNSITTEISYWFKNELAESGRVFCEDLGVVRASDIDFNDVVFDAYIYHARPIQRTTVRTTVNGVTTTTENEEDYSGDDLTDYYFADIYLLAAGGTLEVSLANVNVKNSFKVGKTTMVNTIDERKDNEGNVKDFNNNYVPGGADAVYLGRFNNYSSIISIPIIVTYNDVLNDNKEVLELTAYEGVAPHKICVPINTRWPYERIEINKAYTGFNEYVKTPSPELPERFGEVTGPNDTAIDRTNAACWTDATTIVNDNLYQNISYSIQPVDLYEASGKQGSSSTVTNKEGGYQGGEILVRRRH